LFNSAAHFLHEILVGRLQESLLNIRRRQGKAEIFIISVNNQIMGEILLEEMLFESD